MAKTKEVGRVDWESGDLGNGGYMKLEEGSNVVRIITPPYQFYIHWTTDESGQQKKVKCAVNDCPVCSRGEFAKARWLVGVLNRKTNKPTLLEIGPQIFKQIKALKGKKAWGDPRGFDLDLTRNPKGSNPLYTTTPEAKAKLSDEEITMVKEFIEDTDFDTLVAPSTPEQVREELGLAEDDDTPSDSFDDDVNGDINDDSDDDDFSFE